jgi:CHAT domain-containing protein
LDALLPILGEKIARKLAAELRKMRSKAVVIIPSGLLSIFPIHAAPYAVNGKNSSLLDEFTVTYVPSAMTLEHTRQALQGMEDKRLSLMAVGDPFTEGIPDLPFARTEVEEVAKLFPRSLSLYERDATVQEVLKNFGGTTHLHFSCHGYFNPDSPLDSGILLSNNENMTLRNLLDQSGLSGTRLAVLSACQTAITDFKRLPEEAIGLPAGFLQAGVQGVIGTLWPVNDFSTALLMIQFYRYHINGDPDTREGPMRPAAALRKAQIWLRNVKNRDIKEYVKIALPEFHSRLTASQADGIYKALALENENVNPFEHPYFWAGFTFNGA